MRVKNGDGGILLSKGEGSGWREEEERMRRVGQQRWGGEARKNHMNLARHHALVHPVAAPQFALFVRPTFVRFPLSEPALVVSLLILQDVIDWRTNCRRLAVILWESEFGCRPPPSTLSAQSTSQIVPSKREAPSSAARRPVLSKRSGPRPRPRPSVITPGVIVIVEISIASQGFRECRDK